MNDSRRCGVLLGEGDEEHLGEEEVVSVASAAGWRAGLILMRSSVACVMIV